MPTHTTVSAAPEYGRVSYLRTALVLMRLAWARTGSPLLIAGVLAAILVIAVVQQLAKTAALIVVLIAVGLFLMNGRVENWSF